MSYAESRAVSVNTVCRKFRLDRTSQQSYKSAMALTAEQRIAGAKKSAEMRKLYAEQRKAMLQVPIVPLSEAQSALDKVAEQPTEQTAKRFTDAIDATLDQYLATNDDPKARASLARAIRDLRETWHSITGQPRPGLAKGKPSTRRVPGPSSPDAPA